MQGLGLCHLMREDSWVRSICEEAREPGREGERAEQRCGLR
jgi:hypothetical protein